MTLDVAPKRIDGDLLRHWSLPDADAVRSKEDRGRVLVIAGSPEVPGAALLAGEAALRAGAGKLQVAVPEAVATCLAIALPEAKVFALPATASGGCRATPALEEAMTHADAVLIGAGMEDGDALRELLACVARLARGTVVADAGAIAAFDAMPAFVRTPVITPHAGEMASLLGIDIEEVAAQPARNALSFARRGNVVVVLKSPETWIATPTGQLFVHGGGCPGLGTSGSGDVLAGVLAGLAARGATTDQAAAWAVYLHARAGDELSATCGSLGFLARELPGRIPGWLDRARGKGETPPDELA